MNVIDKIKEYEPFYVSNLKIAIPVILSQVGQGAVMMADTFMVGRLGTDELAAVSFSTSVQVAFFLFAMGVSFGLTPLVGQAYASGDKKKIHDFLRCSLVVNTLLMCCVCFLLWLFSFAFGLMGQEPRVVAFAVPYYRWIVLSLLALPFFFSFKQLLEGLGNTKYAMYITLVSNGLNILLNYLLIFGKCGFPNMGVEGAAIATFISRFCMPFLFVALFMWNKRYRPYLTSLWRGVFNPKPILVLFSIGLPIGGQMFVETALFAIAGIMVGWYGASQLAAHQIVLNFSSLTFMFQTGIASATTIRVSHQMGAGDYVAMRKAGIASFHLSAMFTLAFSLLMVLFRYQLVGAFSADDIVVKTGSTLMLLCVLYQFADGFQVVSLGSLRGMTDVNWPMRVAMVSYLFVSLPVAYILSLWFRLEAVGIWIGFIVGLNLAATCYIVRFLVRSKGFVALKGR